MLCQKCQKNPATTHIKRTVNGNTTEMHLCAGCAHEQGIGLSKMIGDFHGLGSFYSPFENLFGSLFNEPALTTANTKTCPGCGDTFDQIIEKGKVGCPQCYSTFYDNLLPSIERIHGKTHHVGKHPQIIAENQPIESIPQKEENELDSLKKELAKCIENQEYERCAEIRDQIKILEEKQGGESDG